MSTQAKPQEKSNGERSSRSQSTRSQSTRGQSTGAESKSRARSKPSGARQSSSQARSKTSGSTSGGAQRKRTTSASQAQLATVTTEVVTQMARSVAGELVKGQQPINEVAKKAVGEAVDTLDKRGPELADEAGIMNWRYALLGWATWNIGKRVLKRKAKTAMKKVTRGGDHGARRKQLEQGTDR